MNDSASTHEKGRALGEQLRNDAAAMNVQLTDGQADQLVSYLGLLDKWNKVYNLTAVRDPDSMRVQHINDSMAVINPLRAKVELKGASLLDVGSGAGLPGVVLSVAEPSLLVTCVDTVGKKVSFIQQVAAELRLSGLRARQSRVEALVDGPYTVIASRAFSSLSDFVTLTRHLLAPGGVWMALKGKVPTEELALLPSDIDVFHVEQITVAGLDAQRCIVWMRPKQAVASLNY